MLHKVINTARHWLHRSITQKADSKEVNTPQKEFEIYDDAWMFLLGGSNHVSDWYLGKRRLSKKTISSWNRLLEDRLKIANKLGAEYLHIVAPEKLSVYPEKTDLPINTSNYPSSQIESSLAPFIKKNIWLNPIKELTRQKTKHKVYLKTDTHWSFYGAFCTYRLIQDRLKSPINNHMRHGNKEGNWTTMDLGGKLEPPLQEKVYFYTISENIKRIYANDLVIYKEENHKENDGGLHAGSYVIYQNKNPLIDKVVVLFGDSFAEYRSHLLTGMLAETYKEVHFIWSANVDTKLLESIKPDIFLTEVAERFMPTLIPNNTFCLESYCSHKMKTVLALN